MRRLHQERTEGENALQHIKRRVRHGSDDAAAHLGESRHDSAQSRAMHGTLKRAERGSTQVGRATGVSAARALKTFNQ